MTTNIKSWKHPTKNNPKTVTLIGLGPSVHDHYAMTMEPQPSDTILTDEVWTLNRGIFHVKHDVLFVMDNIQGEADSYPSYGAALWNHDRPIITSDNRKGWPRHVHSYPFDEISLWVNQVINPSHGDWWHNSVAYVLAYAAFIGVKELRVWGVDYHHHRSGRVEDGHPNAAYWVGVLERAGLVVKPIGTSTFLGADQRDYIYGYRDDPRGTAVARRTAFREMIQKESRDTNIHVKDTNIRMANKGAALNVAKDTKADAEVKADDQIYAESIPDFDEWKKACQG